MVRPPRKLLRVPARLVWSWTTSCVTWLLLVPQSQLLTQKKAHRTSRSQQVSLSLLKIGRASCREGAQCLRKFLEAAINRAVSHRRRSRDEVTPVELGSDR